MNQGKLSLPMSHISHVEQLEYLSAELNLTRKGYLLPTLTLSTLPGIAGTQFPAMDLKVHKYNLGYWLEVQISGHILTMKF